VRKAVYTAFVAFWAAVATIALVDHPADRDNGEAPRPAEPGYTLSKVARHDAPDDCWMAIEGAVYDLTDYVPRHPAPPRVITEWCGREATEGMRTKGDDSDHSERAWRQLERYRIGTLRQ
jgi:cytochrome b involved in lipid metabolism